MLTAMSLVPPFSTEAKRAKAVKSFTALRVKAKRPLTMLATPETNFPATPGEGGWENQKGAYALISYLLDADVNALKSAYNLALWLRETWAKRDRAHGQRYSWWPIIGRACAEHGLCAPTEFDADFLRWYAYCAADPYVNLKYTGSTLRPLIRIHGAAIHAAHVAEKLVGAGEITAPLPLPPAMLRARAIKSLIAWANTKHVYGTSRWGFIHDDPRPKFDNFPYCDGKTWTAHTSACTVFMLGMIVPYEALMIRLHVSTTEWNILKDFRERAIQMARHAVAWGVHPTTRENMKAIGSGKPGAYVPPGQPGGPTVPPEERSADQFELGYHDWSMAFLASERTPEEREAAVVKWTSMCRALNAGEVPFGLVSVATELFGA
jgi:hypothetical protein